MDVKPIGFIGNKEECVTVFQAYTLLVNGKIWQANKYDFTTIRDHQYKSTNIPIKYFQHNGFEYIDVTFNVAFDGLFYGGYIYWENKVPCKMEPIIALQATYDSDFNEIYAFESNFRPESDMYINDINISGVEILELHEREPYFKGNLTIKSHDGILPW